MTAKASAPPVLHVAEPPPASLGRPPMVVDCSVLSAVLFEEAARDEALHIMRGKTLHAPLLLGSEIASVALKKARGGWPEAVIQDALADYTRQAIQHHQPDVHAQYALALRYGLSAYDAAYLWVAGSLKAPLATFDAKLAKAARQHLGGAA
ncbi:MAG: PIN domain-containing protein [Comamonadaceae bacterium]|nr:MAG: PIN domain-containing protein [Comamonadaceae bacterium]